MVKKTNKRNPLKAEPLHNPGQSLDNQMKDLAFEKVLPTLIYPLVFSILAYVEWRWYLHPSTSPPYVSTIVAAIFLLIALVRLPRYWKTVQQLRQGQKGEIAVGQYLEGLRIHGFEVIHDIVGDGFNVDHVLITRQGVFVIETKTWSKPEKGEAVITYEGDNIKVNGAVPDRNPIRQVKILSKWISEVLKDSSGHDFPVKGVVVFPGWFVDPSCNKLQSDVWILNPKALETFIMNKAECIKPDMVKMASKHLKAFVRSQK